MGRAALHTQAEVFAAADAMAARGELVSVTGLRAVLGGGSNTTIYRHLAEWEDARREKATAIALEQPEAVRAAFATVWQSLTGIVGRQMAEAQDQAQGQVEAAERRVADLAGALAQVEADLEAEVAARSEIEVKLQAMVEAENSRKAADAATIEQMHQRLDALTRERDQAQAMALQSREDYARLQGTTEALRQQVEQFQKNSEPRKST